MIAITKSIGGEGYTVAEKRLGEKQRRFVREWMSDMNATRAAVRAGYAEKSAASTASRLMKDPAVQAYRDQLLEAEVNELGLTRTSMVREIWKIYQRCMDSTPVMIWDKDSKTYVESGQWQFDARGALKAVELMLRVLDKAEKPSDTGGKEAPMGLEDLLAGIGNL